MSGESPIKAAVQQIAEEKGLTVESIVGTIEAALAAAYRKDFGEKNQNIKVEFDLETALTHVFDVKVVVSDEFIAEAEARAAAGEEEPEVVVMGDESDAEVRYNPKLHISVTAAHSIKPNAVVGEEIRTELSVPGEYGRMAAQTAKQVIIQKIREAEHTNVFEAFRDRERQVVTATVQRRDGRSVIMELGRGTGVLPYEEQIPRERYNPGDRLRVYVVSVSQTPRGPQIVLSRSHPEVVRQVFSMEIPEIANGLIVIKGIAREAGSRSKVAVQAVDSNVDPIGSCVGQRGTRVQTIISELGGEKIDIIEFSDDPIRFISNALSPAKVLTLETDDETHTAVATVEEDQLSLAIGKGGQNVRLAAKLTSWRIDIRPVGGDIQPFEAMEEIPADEEEAAVVSDSVTEAAVEEVTIAPTEAAAPAVAPAEEEEELRGE
ncbi:MAG: transcription termination factor NusA [Patescibacteria group bacterium]|jgi:N utilization substance protein A